MYTEDQIAKWVTLQTAMDVVATRIANNHLTVSGCRRYRNGFVPPRYVTERDALSKESVRLMDAYYDGFTATDYSGCNTAARLDLMAAYRKAHGMPARYI